MDPTLEITTKKYKTLYSNSELLITDVHFLF